jgi:hypothetical protein
MNKTAMQQLLEEVEMAESLSSMEYLVAWDVLKRLIKNKLPIERTQIETAYWSGKQDLPLHPNKCKEYFNQLYEQ